MKDKKNKLANEESTCSIIVSYYLYYIKFLKSVNAFHSASSRVFVPALFVWGHLSLSHFLAQLKKVLTSINFIVATIETHHLAETKEEVVRQVTKQLLKAAQSDASLRWNVYHCRLRHFVSRNLGRIVFFIICLIFIADLIYVDIHDQTELMSFIKRGSIFIVLLGLFLRLFGKQLVELMNRIFNSKHSATSIFELTVWRRLIRHANLNGRPFVIIFTQLNILTGGQVHIVLDLVNVLQRHGIICIAVGKKNYLTSILKSTESAIKREYFDEAYAGIDFGQMRFETVFTLNIYLNKRSIVQVPSVHLEDDLSYIDPQLTYLNNEALSSPFEQTVEPFIPLLHMSEANVTGIVESLRLYSAILDITTESKLKTLVIFIFAERYNSAWLDKMCHDIWHPDDADEHEHDESHILSQANIFDKFPKLQQTCADALKENKDMIPILYEMFGRVLPA